MNEKIFTHKHKIKLEHKTIVHLIFIIFFTLSIIVPLIYMFFNMTVEGIKEVFTSKQFPLALKNSLLTSLTATLFSLILALIASYITERVSIRAKSLWSIILVIPMLIPSISHAFGIITLFGKNGLITNLLHIGVDIYGFWGIVLGSVMYSFPVAFLMISSILRYEDSMQYKAARVLGIPFVKQITIITLPFLRKTLISTFFAVFTMIITDYGVPLAIGGTEPTLSTLMYNTAVANANYNNGSVIGVVLLIPAILAFIVDIANPEKNQSGFITEVMESSCKRGLQVLAYLFCVAISLFILLPIIAFGVMAFAEKYPVDMSFTFKHIINTFNRGAGELLAYSLLYAFLVGIVGVSVAFFCAYSTARMKGKLSRMVHLAAIVGMAIPGIVLGLAYLLFFNRSFIYGTILIIVLVNSMHFFSSPYIMMYNTLSKLNTSLEDVGLSLGIPKSRMIFNVIIPKVLPTLLEMFVYFFVNSMMTISAISFLAPPAPQSLALRINRFESQLLMECAAFVSLIILFVNLVIKGISTVYAKVKVRKK